MRGRLFATTMGELVKLAEDEIGASLLTTEDENVLVIPVNECVGILFEEDIEELLTVSPSTARDTVRTTHSQFPLSNSSMT